MNNRQLPTVGFRTANRSYSKQSTPLVQTLHKRVKGRVRYKVRGLQHSTHLQRYLEFKLASRAGIERVRASSCTGNILILFTEEYNPKAIALLVTNIVKEYRQQPPKAIAEDLEQWSATNSQPAQLLP